MERRAVSFVLAGAVALLVAAGVALAATVDCQAGVHCVGTDGPDELYGTGGRDEMDARQGDDALFGRRGPDLMRGDAVSGFPRRLTDGNDQVHGNRGEDFLIGFGGDDLLSGGGGRDNIRAEDHFTNVNPGEDTVIGGAGDDEIEGAQDGFTDTIDCGYGPQDRVVGHDAGLDEIENCEIVIVLPE